MLKAKDIMTKHVATVRKNTPVLEAMKLMLSHDITGVPVVENDMTLVGVVSEKDMLKLFFLNDDSADCIVNIADCVVNDFMTQPAVHFDQEESLDDICQCLVENLFRRVPVTSQGKVVGIISRPDIIGYILRRKGLRPPGPAKQPGAGGAVSSSEHGT